MRLGFQRMLYSPLMRRSLGALNHLGAAAGYLFLNTTSPLVTWTYQIMENPLGLPSRPQFRGPLFLCPFHIQGGWSAAALRPPDHRPASRPPPALRSGRGRGRPQPRGSPPPRPGTQLPSGRPPPPRAPPSRPRDPGYPPARPRPPSEESVEAAAELSARDLEEKEEKAEEKASRRERETAVVEEEEEEENGAEEEEEGTAEDEGEEEDEEEEDDEGPALKRAAGEEDEAEPKRQKTENGASA
ncbi:proline-, glutamic acid- and leucine-rich protein 1-like [Lemur catta]|uniref:proline-, glutamic acid- and leucine-rich protein 1-like n=1 Tax=Lemur catta TaxID=9447 RepID=UPI001E267EA8|nr:proline-, glutamic acid- and leucine-rich protein 1-like [Lemur catta]